MGTDDIFKKRRAKLQERKIESKAPKLRSLLIVSEGTKTEPFYFDGLANYINKLYKPTSALRKCAGRMFLITELYLNLSTLQDELHMISQ